MTIPVETTKLHSLAIDEVSAVDDPASMLPGHMVMKARTSDGVIPALERAIPDGEDLFKFFTGVKPSAPTTLAHALATSSAAADERLLPAAADTAPVEKTAPRRSLFRPSGGASRIW
jgi:hypothetical protein